MTMRQVWLLFAALSVLSGAAPRYALSADPASIPQAKDGHRQTPPLVEERGIVALDQALRAMSMPFTIMCVAARADEVDYGTLAYYHKKIGARAVIVLATRGEGGDSATGPETDRELGLIRTREALEAAKITGADVYFLNLRDFGHAKSADEVFGNWGREEAIARLVRAIRMLRPDVIISNAKAENGYQQAVARLLLEALEAAADVQRFAEIGSDAWQVQRLFHSAAESEGEVTVNLAEYDYLRGRAYAQIGLTASRRLASFGPWPDRVAPGMEKRTYKLLRSATAEKLPFNASLLEGITLTEKVRRAVAPPLVGETSALEAIALREPLIQALTDRLIEKRVEGTVKDLRERYGSEFFRVILFTEAIERALTRALGLDLEIALTDPIVVPGQKVAARLTLHNYSTQHLQAVFHAPESLPLAQAKPAYKTSEVFQAPAGQSISHQVEYEVPADVAPTLPHASRLYEEPFFPVGSAPPGSQTLLLPGLAFYAAAEVNLGQTTLSLPALARLDVAAPIEMTTIPSVILKNWDTPREIEFDVFVHNRLPGSFAGALWVVPLALTAEDYEPARLTFTREDEEVKIKLKLKLPVSKPPLAPDILLEVRREKPASPTPLAAAKVLVKTVDFEVSEGLKVGYISGFDSWLGAALTQLGVAHNELRPDDLSLIEHGNAIQKELRAQHGCGNLTRFDTIIIDSRAYTARPELARHNQCLLRYAQQGGNLVVLYQQPANFFSPGFQADFAPFPIRLSLSHISQETAPVKIIGPEHPLLAKPNKITEKDFEGWTMHRAVYLPREWAEPYTALLESGDPGEEPQKGGLLAAKIGEGFYVYTGFDWKRQLQAMNPGALRMLANLISLPKVAKT